LSGDALPPTHLDMSAVLPHASAALPGAQPQARGFFAHHGIWAPGVKLLRRMGFAAKATTISLAFLVPMLALMAGLLLAQGEQAAHAQRDALRQQVELAHGVLQWAHAQHGAGSLSNEQAQAQARRLLAGLRHDGGEAFWIVDERARGVLNPLEPGFEGRDLGDARDADGMALYQAVVATARAHGRGFVAYRQTAAQAQAPAARLAYVQGFAPWGWIVGASLPGADVQRALWRRGAWVLVGVLLAQAVAGYLFLSFYRVMNGGLREIGRHLSAMADGDLTTAPRGWGQDETAVLMRELATMQASLRGIVAGVHRCSADIVRAGDEIASGAGELAERSERATAHLEKSNAAMGKISAAVASGAEHTAEASRMARRNTELAGDGSRVMREVVDTMEDIRTASARIGEIVGTIDGIAFQTNILALNAAVEAARAGPQGRGFGVVAAEVRTLAQRSADAAREIKALVQGSVQQVDAGARVVRKAGTAMQDIVTASQRVDDLLGEVATGAREQSADIGQVGAAVQELERMTQQNQSRVAQTAASARAMRELAHALSGEVARFRMPAGG
jgi:methyl-accepting chemotaxis protein